MNELKIFENKEFGQVRTMKFNSKVYFVASDVAKSLGYKDAVSAISRHCKGAVKCPIPTNGGEQQMNIIPEGDIYRLVIKSELPSAEKFESWVFDDVLPTIRKHGAYATDNVIDEILNNPEFGIELLTELKEERAERLRLQKENEYKKEVLKGVTEDIDLYTKRNVLNKVVRHNKANYSKRWNELYDRFKEVHSIDLKARCEGHNLKQPKIKDKLSTIKYAEQFGHLDNLYKVAVRLYETDVNEILEELKKIN